MQKESERAFINYMTHVFIKDLFPWRSGEYVNIAYFNEDYKKTVLDTNSVREITKEEKECFTFKDFTMYGD